MDGVKQVRRGPYERRWSLSLTAKTQAYFMRTRARLRSLSRGKQTNDEVTRLALRELNLKMDRLERGEEDG